MNQTTHVGLMVALGVAVSLHALLFLSLSDFSEPVGLGGDVMQVEVLAAQQKVKPSLQPFREDIKENLPQDKSDMLAIKEMGEPVLQDTVDVENDEQVKQVDHQVSHALASQDAQRLVLSKVQYPRQARRHGWQGTAEFEFAIYEQNIQHITMLISTGHAVLDRAATRGFQAVQMIPLPNGSYRMPVVFRLQ